MNFRNSKTLMMLLINRLMCKMQTKVHTFVAWGGSAIATSIQVSCFWGIWIITYSFMALFLCLMMEWTKWILPFSLRLFCRTDPNVNKSEPWFNWLHWNRPNLCFDELSNWIRLAMDWWRSQWHCKFFLATTRMQDSRVNVWGFLSNNATHLIFH